jgi:Phage gp6-like head-tail connector protein
VQIVTLAEVKLDLNITHDAQDARLTGIINRAENEILQYCNLANMDAFYGLFGDTDVARAGLESAVRHVSAVRFHNALADIWAGGFLARLLMPYRQPAFSSGTTE